LLVSLLKRNVLIKMTKMLGWRMLLLYFVLLCSLPATFPLDPLTSGLGVGATLFASMVWNSRDTVLCQFRECCREPYYKKNLEGLKESLNDNVFGQHIVLEIVTKTLQAHTKKRTPNKALVLGFYGWTGSGKNYVSKFIAESLYKYGMESNFVHHFFSSIHFPKVSEAESYKSDIQSWIKGNVSLCERSLFIFDEIDKLPPGVIDAIKPFIDFHDRVDDLDFRKSIFIFLSNTGGKDISDLTYSHWKSGRSREELTVFDLEPVLNAAAFNEKGGLQKTELIRRDLIDASIPFLPLEKSHVKLCIRRELEVRAKRALEEPESEPFRDYTDTDIDEMADRINYNTIFSTSGCKKVATLVDRFQEGDW